MPLSKKKIAIILAGVFLAGFSFMLANATTSGYLFYPWSQENDTACWSYFMAYHEESIDKIALNIHIRNQIAQHGSEFDVPWRNIEIKDFDAHNLHIMVTGNWHGSFIFENGEEILQSVILTEDIAEFEGIKSVERAEMICA